MDRIDDNRAIERVLPPERTALQTRTVAQFESGADMITQREIADTRDSLDSRGVGTLTNDYPSNYEETSSRYLAPARQPLAERDYNRVLTSAMPAQTQVATTTDQTYADALKNYYDPFSMSASSGTNSAGGISVIPGGDVQSGNSNTLLIFLVIGIGVLAGYWYYKKGGFSNGV